VFMNVPGENFKGVYSANEYLTRVNLMGAWSGRTDTPVLHGQRVAVVGGGNSAGQAAVYLARFAEEVTMLVRGGSLGAGMSAYLVDQIAETPNISVRLRASVTAVAGGQALESIEVADSEAGTSDTLPMAAMFVFIGQAPRTDWLSGLVERDQAGFVVTGPGLTRSGDKVPGWPLAREPFMLETSVPGIFCAGDVRSRSVKRIASAVGEGSMAVQFVHQHLAGL